MEGSERLGPARGVEANAEKVRLLTKAMMDAYAATATTSVDEAGEPIHFDLADGIMSGHNVHKMIVLDVLERSNPTRHQRYALLAGVRETWIKAIDAEIKRKAD